MPDMNLENLRMQSLVSAGILETTSRADMMHIFYGDDFNYFACSEAEKKTGWLEATGAL